MPKLSNKALTVSIIIPVYNEERHLKACLESIASQTVRPHEVIVVDNNSTDDSVKIAKSYPFVRVVSEKRQGRGFARSKGFDVATGDILGRLDGDSVLSPDWCERVTKHFNDPKVGGVTGLARGIVLPYLTPFQSVLWSWVYCQWSVLDNGFDLLWGANCAVRRSAWRQVRRDVCNDDKLVHEDHDLAYAILGKGHTIKRDNNLLIFADIQGFHYFPKLMHYTLLRAKTHARHKHKRIPHTYGWPRRVLLGAILLPVTGVLVYGSSMLLFPLEAILRIVRGRGLGVYD